MEVTVDWTLLPADALRCISNLLSDPQDLVSLRAACPAWREALPQDAHRRFHPWIVESDATDASGNVLFYSPVSGDYHLIHVAALEGRRIAGYGAGLLLGVDTDDELSAVLVNPLTGESVAPPRLPECFRGAAKYAFATDPDVTGEGGHRVVVAVYNRQAGPQGRSHVALWHRGGGGGGGWATMRSETFWMRMLQIRARLLAHGPQVVEAEEAAIAAMNGHAPGYVAWHPGARGAHVIEHEGHVRVLVRLELPAAAGDAPVRPGDPLPRVSFQLRDTVDAGGDAVDWADAPELHGKVIFQSLDTSCYVLPPASGRFVGLSSNSVYFLSWQRQEEVDEDGCVGDGNAFGYFLCKWDMVGRVATVVKKLPGAWERQKPGRWFLPTFKY